MGGAAAATRFFCCAGRVRNSTGGVTMAWTGIGASGGCCAGVCANVAEGAVLVCALVAGGSTTCGGGGSVLDSGVGSSTGISTISGMGTKSCLLNLSAGRGTSRCAVLTSEFGGERAVISEEFFDGGGSAEALSIRHCALMAAMAAIRNICFRRTPKIDTNLCT